MTDVTLYLDTSIRITGTVEIETDPETGETARYVLQRTAKGNGNIPQPTEHDMQLRRHVVPYDPRTPTQLAGRARIAAATAAWHAMTEAEREAFRNRARRLYMTGFNLHIKLYCEVHAITEFLDTEPEPGDYQPPAGNQLHFSWFGTDPYSPPAGNQLHFTHDTGGQS